ncbi:MAG: DUF934 domain-containing protein [Gammaproteobacteria bacterium]|nr:DUF934 domain-containing protein [Gammaproteobacteria bacterium]
MPTLLKGTDIVNDEWHIVDDGDGMLPAAGDVIVSLERWLEIADELRAARRRAGVWLDVDAEPESIAGHLDRIPLIAIRFPAFNDGRGLSLAALLRTRHGYEGELRAIGAIHEDLVHYLVRCGFDSYLLPDGRNTEVAQRGLSVMSDYYQGSVIDPQPAFKRHQRGR